MKDTKITNVNLAENHLLDQIRACSLKKHIHTVHEGHKDHKYDYCGNSW